MSSISRRGGIGLLLATVAVVAVVCSCLPPIPQPPSYHHFADQRGFAGIPNFGDVISNLPFAVVGIWGLLFVLCLKPEDERLLDSRERWPWVLAFAGLLCTAFGSSYYHLAPDNARLVWDRLPMTMVFTALVAAMIVERISVRAGLWLLPFLMGLGAMSVLQWYASEVRGLGDLRFYAAVQVCSALALLLVLLLPPRYTRGSDLAAVVGFYVLAKLLETFDRAVFASGHLVSGHTLKHLAAATAGYWILRMAQKRRPLALPS